MSDLVQSHTEQSSTVSSQDTAENAAPKMDPALKAKWVEALRSGEHKQCKNALHDDGGYCCLGVLTVVAGYQIDTKWDRVLRPGDHPGDMPSNAGYLALADFGLTDRIPLINMNDGGNSFAEIADFIESNL